MEILLYIGLVVVCCFCWCLVLHVWAFIRMVRAVGKHDEGIGVSEDVCRIEHRDEVQRIQSDACERLRHIGRTMVPGDAIEPEYIYTYIPCRWLRDYVLFLRYIDCRLLIVWRKDYDKVRKYAESLEKGTAILLFLVLTSPVVAYFTAAE